MDAFFCVDKPSGMTSFDVLRSMRRILGVKKIGHTGTLDPLATGCMIVATGNYTKCLSLLEKQDKTYEAQIHFDGTSDSYDSDTDIEYMPQDKQLEFKNSVDTTQIKNTLSEQFQGEISQIPPKYSALKINGKRTLDRTLAGEEIKMQARKAHIYNSKILSYRYPCLQIELHVSSGTYIRSIGYDLGKDLGGVGGYLSSLRRTAIGDIGIEQAIKLDDVSFKSQLHPQEIFPKKNFITHDNNLLSRLGYGQRVRGEYSFPTDIPVLLSDGQELRYIIVYSHGVVHPQKKIV